MMCYANLVSAGVAELADAHDSKSCGAIRAGSSPATGMIRKSILWASFFMCCISCYNFIFAVLSGVKLPAEPVKN